MCVLACCCVCVFEGANHASAPCPQVLECIKVSEDTTTSSSRIFVKILFQELCAYMGLPRLNERLKDMYVLGGASRERSTRSLVPSPFGVY